MDAQDGRGVRRVYAAVFHAPEPSLRGFIGDVGWLGIVGAGFSLYHRVWLTAVVGLLVAAVAWPVAVWLQRREPTTSFVELPPIAVHYLYPLPMVGILLLGVAILIGEAALAVVGTVMTALGSVGLWLSFRRRRRFGG